MAEEEDKQREKDADREWWEGQNIAELVSLYN